MVFQITHDHLVWFKMSLHIVRLWKKRHQISCTIFQITLLAGGIFFENSWLVVWFEISYTKFGVVFSIISRDELIMLENLVYDILNYTKWFTKIFSCDLKIINTKWKNIVEITMCDLKNHLVWLFCSIILCRPVWL